MNKTTFMAKPGQVERKWYVVDATDVPLGRLSAVVASVLRGKNKPGGKRPRDLVVSCTAFSPKFEAKEEYDGDRD